jgi:hypothetical protein
VIADGLGDAGSTVVVIAGVVVAIGTLWRMVLRPIGTRLGALAIIVERELEPNGGDSLRDQIDAIRADLIAHMAAEDRSVADLAARLEALTAAVEAMTAWARSHDHMHTHLGDDHR